ncbi:MAG: AAA family ATPase [Sphingobacteriales bacterium]
MTNEQKRQVREALLRYTSNFDTQTQAAESLQGISASTISQVRNNNWELLSERLWHHIARQVGFYCGEWQPADTGAYLLLRILFSDAQHYAMAYGISIGAGLGKTFTAGHYTRENENTFYLAGNEEFNRKSFICALLNSAGMEAKGTVPDMMKQFADYLSDKEEPLLIIDDAHKLKDRVLHLVVLLANSLAGKAGVIIMGDGELRMRIINGVRLKKVGYDDIYKSIGRRFITLGSLGPKDVELVCRANGLYDEEIIKHINEECDNNLHTATRLINQYTQMNIAA